MRTNKITINDVIKFLIATAIILLGFLRKGENIGETEEDLYFNNYLDKESEIQNIETNHGSAPQDSLCKNNDSFCKKIDVQKDDIDEPVLYTNQVYSATNFINDNQVIEKKIIDTIKKITIKNSITERRGYATRDTIVLDIGSVNDINEFENLSSHELGHVFDLGAIQGTKSQKSDIFTEFNKSVFSINDPSLAFYKISWISESTRKREATKKDFCSGYGMTNPFEDFSECFNLYLNHQKLFKFIATKNKNLAKKYNFIATTLQGAYISPKLQDITLVKENNNRRPRDTTKL